jgi:uncharacterized membrane protein YqaE (UPF0057 family)
MKTTRLFLILLLISSTILSSCSVQRRYHRDGLNISWNHSSMKKDKNADQIIEATEESTITQRTEITTSQMQTFSSDNVSDADNAVSSSEFTSALASTENQELENVSLSDETPVSVPQNTTKKQLLSKKETQHSLNTKTMKQQFSALKQDAKSNNKAADDDSYILYVILAFIIPPLAVFLYEGSEWTQRCTINLILTLLCGIPGLIHALVIILGKR